jgi:hypothetical protein
MLYKVSLKMDNSSNCLYCNSSNVNYLLDGGSIQCHNCIAGRTPHHYCKKTNKIENDHCPTSCQCNKTEDYFSYFAPKNNISYNFQNDHMNN